MKFCPVVPEICRGQVHGPRKERRKRRRIIIIIIIIIIIKIKIIIRNGAKTISLPNLFGRLNYERICLIKSKFCLNLAFEQIGEKN
jgi:accessory gene regulator protein AgrB